MTIEQLTGEILRGGGGYSIWKKTEKWPVAVITGWKSSPSFSE